MPWFFGRKKPSLREWNKKYRSRPVVPPETLYPLINRGLDCAFGIQGYGARALMSGAFEATDNSVYAKLLDNAKSEHLTEYRELYDALTALQAVGISEQDGLALTEVQLACETFLLCIEEREAADARAFHAMTEEDKKNYQQHDATVKKYQGCVDNTKPILESLFRSLHESNPKQFSALGLSEANMRNLGIEDLWEDVPF